uniref:Uncharacterized protein n=1 Tax=Ananas comosus var. bracteatus TaxID=296719 RepID=A0A6V7NXC7_ANACO|nr:unnamed protein product [Ananas comosus var. bracteatus]
MNFERIHPDTLNGWVALGWGQLVCTVVSAVILSFSTLVTGKVTSPITFYTTAGSIAAAFVSVFWSFGYIRLSERLKRTANEPARPLHVLMCPYYLSSSILSGDTPGRSPVLALDVFLVQASANTILSHFLGLVCSLELLRSVTLPAPEAVAIPKAV